MRLLAAAASGDELTAYHVEAGIAAYHAAASSTEETSWGEIVALYDLLMKIAPSPVVALNRAMAIAENEGPEQGLAAIRAIRGSTRLADYPFFQAALGELELRNGRQIAAREHFQAAHELARNDGERRFLQLRIAECQRLLAPR
jgi:RNA polymerase sigma-70 factor (ECF subfamily)